MIQWAMFHVIYLHMFDHLAYICSHPSCIKQNLLQTLEVHIQKSLSLSCSVAYAWLTGMLYLLVK